MCVPVYKFNAIAKRVMREKPFPSIAHIIVLDDVTCCLETRTQFVKRGGG
jgi:hypothetical protein